MIDYILIIKKQKNNQESLVVIVQGLLLESVSSN